MARYGQPVMLLTTEWHPWFSYEWWADIGAPALSAVMAGLAAAGSVAVGMGAVRVARTGNLLARSIADREAAAAASAARADFATEVKDWLDLRFAGLASGDLTRSFEAFEVVELKAGAVGQSAAKLLVSLLRGTQRVGDGTNAVDRLLTKMQRDVALSSISAWVRDPEEWKRREHQASIAQLSASPLMSVQPPDENED